MATVAPGPAALLLFALMILFMLPSNYPANQSKVTEYIKTQTDNIYTLKNARWDGNDEQEVVQGVNLTGVNWPLVPKQVEQDGIELWRGQKKNNDGGGVDEEYTYYSNITGMLSSGSWQLQESIEPTVEQQQHQLDNQTSVQFIHNISGIWDGLASLYLTQSSLQGDSPTWDTEKVQLIDATIDVEASDQETVVGIEMNGIYLVEEGRLLLSTSSREYCGFGALPFLMTPPNYYSSQDERERVFNLTRGAVIGGLEQHIKEIQQSYDGDILLSSGDYAPPPINGEGKRNLYVPCEYVIYGQMDPIHMSRQEANYLERELRQPIGRPHKQPVPLIEVHFQGYSTNCASRFKGKAQGPKIEIYWKRIHTVGIMSTILSMIQIYLSMDQIARTDTPSSLCRVSMWTIGIMTLNDGFFCLTFLTAAIYIEPAFLVFMTAVFSCFLLVSAFEMRFLMSIYEAQFPERQAAAAAAAAAQQQEQQQEGLPTPASTAAAAPQERMSVSKIYTSYCIILGGTIITILNSFSWSRMMRNGLMNLLILASNSYWIPQIYRNTMRGTRKSFTFKYVIGTSIVRIIPGLYIYLDADNIFMHYESALWSFILFSFVWVQVIFIKSQEMLGPRWFIPSQLLPPTYNYHPKQQRRDEEEQQGDGDGGDCVICMQPLNLHSGKSDKSFMTTPCNHIFHTACLESWMRYRLQCPICRSSLPPI